MTKQQKIDLYGHPYDPGTPEYEAWEEGMRETNQTNPQPAVIVTSWPESVRQAYLAGRAYGERCQDAYIADMYDDDFDALADDS